MPEITFRRLINKEDYPSVTNIVELAEIFDVSFEACANRYVALNDDPLAIIFSRDGVVHYSLKGSNFPYWITPSRGDSLPIKSVSNSAKKESYGFVATDTIFFDIWLGESKGYESPSIVVEEAYLAKDGYMRTLLRFEDVLKEVE